MVSFVITICISFLKIWPTHRHCIHEPWRSGKQDGRRTEATENHPLITQLLSDKISIGRLSTSSRTSSVAALDPLSTAFDGIDPLSQFALESERQESSAETPESVSKVQRKTKREVTVGSSQMESWSSRRAAILNKYTTTERLSIVTSFLSGGETSALVSQIVFI